MALPSIGRPEDISRDGHLIDAALDYTGICILVLFAAMVAVMAWSIARHRAGRAQPLHDHGKSRGALLFTLLVLGAIFVVVDVVELLRAWADVTTVFWRFPSGKDVTRVEVMAQQWAWDVRHAGPDGNFGTDDDPVTLNELHVPAGRPVVIAMRSKDVVHSLYLPNVRLKQDAVPGMTTRLWFVAEKPGEFDPRKYLKPAMEAMTKLCKQRLQEFNTAGQASKIKKIVQLSDMAKRYAKGELDPVIGRAKAA